MPAELQGGKIFITGATGFVGKEVLREAVTNNYLCRCLVRSGSENKLVETGTGVEIIHGDLSDRKSPYHYMEGCHTVIHLVGIIKEIPSKGITFHRVHYELTKRLIDASVKREVRRFLLLSANGSRKDGVSPYQTTKALAEEYLVRSGLNYTVFKPSVIFGDPEGRGEFMTELKGAFFGGLTSPPFLPNIDGGGFSVSPVSVRDLARGIIKSIDTKTAFRKTYCIGGTARVSWKELLGTLNEVTGHRKILVNIPSWLIKGPAKLMQKLGVGPITYDQLIMLLEGNTCDGTEFFRDMGIEPARFSPENLQYLTDQPVLVQDNENTHAAG